MRPCCDQPDGGSSVYSWPSGGGGASMGPGCRCGRGSAVHDDHDERHGRQDAQASPAHRTDGHGEPVQDADTFCGGLTVLSSARGVSAVAWLVQRYDTAIGGDDEAVQPARRRNGHPDEPAVGACLLAGLQNGVTLRVCGASLGHGRMIPARLRLVGDDVQPPVRGHGQQGSGGVLVE